MHELSICFKIVEIAEDAAEKNGNYQVDEVALDVGEVSLIIPSYLIDCWNWAKKKTKYLQSAKLKIETIPAITYCQSCKNEYSTVKFGKICPLCKSDNTFLLSGNDIEVKNISVIGEI